MDKIFSLVSTKVIDILVPYLDKFIHFIYIVCDVSLLLLIATCYLPFESMGMQEEAEWLRSAMACSGYFILAAYIIKEMFVFLKNIHEAERWGKAMSILRFVAMIALCVILGYATYSLLP